MKPDIKQRIEQIRQGEVPEGYTQSKYGIYPINWDVKKLGHYIKEYKELSNDIQTFPVYSSTRKGLMRQSEYYEQKEASETNMGYRIVPCNYVTYRHMSDDDIFHFNINNTGSKILVSSEYPVFNLTNEAALGFLIPILNYSVYFRYFCRTQKQGGTRTRLYFKNLSQYHIPFPPLPEQQKIADILTTQDKVIELKEQLLAQKQQQKKYLMQQLLTGKKRLPGFNGEWDIKPLKKIVEKQKSKNNDFKYQLVLSNSAQHGIISQEQEFDKEIANEERIDGYYIVIPEAFVYNPRISVTAPCGPINMNETGETGIISPLYTVFTVSSSEISQIFLKYYFKSSCWHKYVKGVANYGARHDRISISDGDFFEMPIFLPVDKEEQTAIANVLSTADREIDLLRQSIESEKQKKKALMQLLLTGIVRVNV